jgi:hopene-associated glycosyltransferase HpnB
VASPATEFLFCNFFPDVIYLIAAGAVIWFSILLVPWRPWSTRERLEVGAENCGRSADLADITVLIPARDEAEHIADTLNSVREQGTGLSIFLIDDESSDGTAEIARQIGGVTVIPGQALPAGWTGKLWALEQGRQRVSTPLILLLDADISLAPGTLAVARARMREQCLGFLSLMAELRMQSLWERLLMPAFVFFFKLLYPFHVSNGSSRLVAAAAGGFVLVRTEALERIGGFGALSGEIIDDCGLAARVKQAGFRTWIGLTHSVRSQRVYDDLRTIWDMVARTAYTQLRHSSLLLGLCTLAMLAAFWFPVLGLGWSSLVGRTVALVSLAAMAACYWPTLRYYRLSAVWIMALPIAGTLFLAMTWSSALRYWSGERSRWKGRRYAIEP